MLDFIVLVGYPCSGKSSWTKMYCEKNPNTIVISLDDTILKHYSIEDYNNNIFDHKRMEKIMIQEMLTSIKESKSNIIIDKTNCTIKSRNRVLATVNNSKYKITCNVFHVDQETFIERNNERFNDTGKYIPLSTFYFFSSIYEQPTYNEKIDVINFL